MIKGEGREEFPTELATEGEARGLKVVRQVAVLVQKTVFLNGETEYQIEIQESEGLSTMESSEVLGLLQYAVLREEAQLIIGMNIPRMRNEGSV